MMVYFWNLMFFYFFVWFKHLYKLFSYINPATYIAMIPFVKRGLAKKGIKNFNQDFDSHHNCPKGGFTLTYAGGQMAGLIISVEFALIGLMNLLFQFNPFIGYANLIWVQIAILVLPAILFNHFVLYRKNRYLTYFKKFEKMDVRVKRKYGWLCFAAAMIIWSLFFFSLPLLALNA